MKTLKIAIFVFLPAAFFLSGCGLKKHPVPPEDAEITYPGCYPNPELEDHVDCSS